MTALVDTSAFIAVLLADDQNHTQAADIFRRLMSAAEPPVTHNYVVLETCAVLQRRSGIAAVRKFTDDIMPVVRMEWVSEEDHAGGVAALLTSARRELSLVDCVSFALMRRLGLARAFCFDPHFAEQGFEVCS
jgi:predicted nucleic acid-binding protein